MHPALSSSLPSEQDSRNLDDNHDHHPRLTANSPTDGNTSHSYSTSQSLPSSPEQPRHSPSERTNLPQSSIQRPRPAALSARPNLRRASTLSIISEVAIDVADLMSHETVPSSPPSLSSSRSSVISTSVRTNPSDEDLHDIAHFEEISLNNDDLDHAKTVPEPLKRETLKPRPMLRSAYTTTAIPSKHGRSSTNLRDLTTDLRATAALNNHAQRHSPTSTWQSTFTPRSPTLSVPGPHRRTPSPKKSPAFSSSPLSPSSPSARMMQENSPILPQPRPGLRQQGKRKTQQELEDEFRDSDDELPEDAFIWNIPLSPRPLHARSPSVSPERENGPERGSFAPRDRFTRTKSWSAALKDLSEDAKKLTAVLEHHFDAERHNMTSSPGSSTASSPRPSMNQRSKTASMPPIQRTRPSWLPPKCPKEERKHLQEYEMMMKAMAKIGS